METKNIHKEIAINAPKEKVWQTLTEQPYLNDWTSSFMTGSVVQGTFSDGAEILYIDTTNNSGVVGKVTEFEMYKNLKISIVAELKDGAPAYDDPESAKWEGTYDHYQLAEENGTTTLTIESAFPAEFYNDFVPGWEKMSSRIKEIAEQ